jgi:hypothetical protein
MRTLAGHFLNQSFGEKVVSARIAVLNEPIAFQVQPPDPGYMSVVGASGSLQ